jgi:hypothetical protein
MPTTDRIYFGHPFNGRRKQNWQMPGVIDNNSVVVITACEYDPTVVPPGMPDERHRFVENADIWIKNVAPHGAGSPNSGVEFVIQVDWDSPLFVSVDVTVLDNVPRTVTHL